MKSESEYERIILRRVDELNRTHCEDGPAMISMIHEGRTKFIGYFIHGEAHRTNGPAKTWSNNFSEPEYWVNGKHLPDIKSDTELMIKLLLE
jgi:hypothetical protein